MDLGGHKMTEKKEEMEQNKFEEIMLQTSQM
jgi:hypothetical protein